jgi:multisubunit Na+/H+ antiporter MnhB subunit
MAGGAIFGAAIIAFLNSYVSKKNNEKEWKMALPFVLGLAVGAGAVVAFNNKDEKN